VIEIYFDDVLAYEIVTSPDSRTVQVLPSSGSENTDGNNVIPLLEMVLPMWRHALMERDLARGR